MSAGGGAGVEIAPQAVDLIEEGFGVVVVVEDDVRDGELRLEWGLSGDPRRLISVLSISFQRS